MVEDTKLKKFEETKVTIATSDMERIFQSSKKFEEETKVTIATNSIKLPRISIWKSVPMECLLYYSFYVLAHNPSLSNVE